MIKVQGLGRRHLEISHDDAIAHHRHQHSQLGLGQAEHMAKYVLYYFEKAFDPDGKELPDVPWDMSALEWFRKKEYWDNFQEWLSAAPDGQEVKTDEARFLDREKCFMLPYEESVVVDRACDANTVNLVRLLRLDRASAGTETKKLAIAGVAEIKAHFGDALRKLVINRITEATSLATGKVPDKPVDVIQIYKIEKSAADSFGDLVSAFSSQAIAGAERKLFNTRQTVHLLAEEVIFIA